MKNKLMLALIMMFLAITLLSACGDNSAPDAMEIQDSTDASVTSDMSEAEDSSTEDTADYMDLTPPSDELLKQIGWEYSLYCANEDKGTPPETFDCYVQRYYGSFSGAIPVTLRSDMFAYITATVDVKIADSIFKFGNGPSITVWKDGSFYSLEEAYDQGLLTEEQISIIAHFHKYGGYIEFERTE